MRGYIADDSVGKTPIDHLFYALRTNKFLEEKITGSIVGEDEIGYRCKCSRERVASAILGIGKDELESMVNEGKDVDISCQFCDKVYDFTPDELREINTPEKT